MPIGTAISVAPPVTINVPRIAGPMPGPGARDTSGIVAVKKSGKCWNAIAAPRSITDHSTATSGIATATTAAPIRPIISWFLTVRHDGRARRSLRRRVAVDSWKADVVVMRPGSASSSAGRSWSRSG
jgi:hypothetical protein